MMKIFCVLAVILPVLGTAQLRAAESEVSPQIRKYITQLDSGLIKGAEFIRRANEALAVSQKNKDLNGEAEILLRLGLYYYNSGFPDKPLEYFQKTFDKAARCGNLAVQSQAKIYSGLYFNKEGDYNRAMKSLHDGMELAARGNYREGILLAYMSLATFYNDMGMDEEALNYAEEAENILNKIDSKLKIELKAWIMREKAQVFLRRKEYGQSMDLSNRALVMVGDKKNSLAVKSRGWHCFNLGENEFESGNLEEAEKHFFRAYENFKQLGGNYGFSRVFQVIGALEYRNRNFAAALEFSQRAIRESKTGGVRLDMKNAMRIAALATYKLKKFRQAAEFFLNYEAVRKELAGLEVKKQVLARRIRFEVREKAREILLLKRENRIQKLELRQRRLNNFLLVTGLFLFILLTLAFCFFYLLLRRKKKLIEKKNRELESQLTEIDRLRGIIPICSYCKKVRDDEGYWNQVEAYLNRYSRAEFSHGICPDCMEKYYPDLDGEKESQ